VGVCTNSPLWHGYTLTELDDVGCLASLYGRALMAPPSSVNEMSTVTSAPTSSSDKLVTVTVDSYTTVPCSTEETGTGASTTTVSKHTTSTDLITVTIISSRFVTFRNVDSLADSDSQQHFHFWQ
jgi:hypothetical protein